MATLTMVLAACGTDSTPAGDGGAAGGGGSGEGGSGGTVPTSSSSGGASGSCVEHWDCTEGQVCLEQQCNIAWGRQLRIVAYSADIPGTNPATGAAWDVAGGAPDPYVQFLEGDTVVAETEAKGDTFTPVWSAGYELTLEQAGLPFSVFVYDADVDGDDYIIAAIGEHGQWLTVVRDPALAGTLVTDDGMGTTLTLNVTPL